MSLGQLLSKDLETQRAPYDQSVGHMYPVGKGGEGRQLVTSMLLGKCVVGHRTPDVSLGYAFDLFLVIYIDSIKI